MSPSENDVTVGSTVDVTVSIAGLTGEGVGDYDLALVFDESVVSFVDVGIGPYLDGPLDSLQFVFPLFGEVEVFESSFGFLDLQIGLSSFELFTATFDVVGAGTSLLDLGIFAIGDFFGGPLEVGVQSASSTATDPVSVPEPGTLGLLAAGLLGLVLSRRRRPQQI